jgi:hypothetical protein
VLPRSFCACGGCEACGRIYIGVRHAAGFAGLGGLMVWVINKLFIYLSALSCLRESRTHTHTHTHATHTNTHTHAFENAGLMVGLFKLYNLIQYAAANTQVVTVK